MNSSESDAIFAKCNDLDGGLVPLNEFIYSNGFMGCVMKEVYDKIDFVGVTVSVCAVHLSCVK